MCRYKRAFTLFTVHAALLFLLHLANKICSVLLCYLRGVQLHREPTRSATFIFTASLANLDGFLLRYALYKHRLCRRKISSVCLTVTRRYCVETATHVIKLFRPAVSNTVLAFPYQTLWQYSGGYPLMTASNARVCKIAIFDQYLALSGK